jgi:hypothetical protein
VARRRAALGAVALGLGIAAAAQVVAPLATPPLYDGVVVVQPYVYVNPPAGKPGGAQGASAHLPVAEHKSPLVVLATPEQPPQAQVVAGDGSLVLPSSATALDVSITPLDPSVDSAAASTARVLGNVYRITLVDQAGSPATAPASALVTVVLRAPEDVAGAQVGLLGDGAWHPLKSEPMFGSTYVAVVTGFGDFAVVAPGSTSPAPSGVGARSPSGLETPAAGMSSSAAGSGESVATAGPGGGAGSSGSPGAVAVGALAIVLLLGLIAVAYLFGVRRRRSSRQTGWSNRRRDARRRR